MGAVSEDIEGCPHSRHLFGILPCREDRIFSFLGHTSLAASFSKHRDAKPFIDGDKIAML
jgi:hypothetical protein